MASLDIKYKGYEDFFRKYVEVLSPFLGIPKKEKEFLAELMFQDYSRRDYKVSDRYTIIFSYENKVAMCTKLKKNNQSLRNSLTNFRKKNFIIKDKQGIDCLAPYLRVNPDKLTNITFNFVKHEQQ